MKLSDLIQILQTNWPLKQPDPTLLSVLKDPKLKALYRVWMKGNSWERCRVIKVLSQRRSPETIKILCQVIQDPNWIVRRRAIRVFCDKLQDISHPGQDDTVRQRVTEVIVQMGAPGIEALWYLVREGDRHSREMAVAVLEQIPDERVIRPLCAALGDTSYGVRERAKAALVKIGEPAIIPLSHFLNDQIGPARLIAVEALGEIGSSQVIGPLFYAMGNLDPTLSLRAQHTLAKIGLPAVDKLCGALHGSILGYKAQHSLVLMGAPAVPALCAMLDSARFYASERAREALIKIGLPAVAPLCQVLISESPLARKEAALALGEIGHVAAIEPLCHALQDPDHQVRGEAACALGKMTDRYAVPLLCQALADEEATVRQRVAEALGHLGQREILPLLRERLNLAREHNLGVQAALRKAIRSIEARTEATRGLPRAGAIPLPDAAGLPRTLVDAPAPEGRPRTIEATSGQEMPL